MADKTTGKPAPPPVPARSVAEPDSAETSAPAVPPDPGGAPASVRESLKAVQRRPAARPAPVRKPTPPPSVREVAPAAGVSTRRREVTVDDQVWVLRQEGAGCVGYDRGAGTTILSIGLRPQGERDESAATRYVLARNLDDVAEEELVYLVREVARAPDTGSNAPGRTPGERPRKTSSRRHARRRPGPRR